MPNLILIMKGFFVYLFYLINEKLNQAKGNKTILKRSTSHK